MIDYGQMDGPIMKGKACKVQVHDVQRHTCKILTAFGVVTYF